jgi:hypothetical protein
MAPFEGVGLGHGDEGEQTRSITLPSAAPVFATQPMWERWKLNVPKKKDKNYYLSPLA